MLNKLLSIATLLTLTQSTDFNHEVNYNLTYNFEDMGFLVHTQTFTLNDDLLDCPNNVEMFYKGEPALDPIYNYNKTTPLILKDTDGTAGVNPNCPIKIQIIDLATDTGIAEQTAYYNNKTDVFSVGFFKPLMDNVNITSNAVNDLTIDNTFHA